MENGEILEEKVKYEMDCIQSWQEDFEAGAVDFVTCEVMKAYHEGKLYVYNQIRRSMYAE